MKNNKSDKFDNFTLWNIIKKSKYDPFDTLEQLKVYIEKYPTDIVAYRTYIIVLIDLGRFEEAETIINFIEHRFPNFIDEKFIFNKFRLFCFTGRFEEANEMYKAHKEELLSVEPRIDFFDVIYRLQKGEQLERHLSPERNYLYNQIVDYNKDDFVEHIKKHTADYNLDIEDSNHAIFNPDFPIDDIIDELEKIIPNENKTYFGFSNNFYVFKFNNAGRVSNKSVDFFRVVTLNGTNHFITMYPMEHGELLPHIDLNHLNKSVDSPKVRQLSRLEKFNQKYEKYLKTQK